uniref:Uncharacterized protein n=1 Tax=Siphoviridae sp. ctcfw7 TaxID=2826394 RepID=A0A8S5MG43_9CAUD|nr:MAG TPA: hypothetical protein [Siphoviridae sp. ctcfw7]DAK80729.1 MAG TPA: hypothetical protein [Caudoviricetes sp.]
MESNKTSSQIKHVSQITLEGQSSDLALLLYIKESVSISKLI